MAHIDTLKGFHRQYSGPLDSTSVFNEIVDNKLIYRNSDGSEATFDNSQDFVNYYAKQPIAYCGQIVSIVEPSDKTIAVYKIVGSDDNVENRSGELLSALLCEKVSECNEIPIN